jgi:hypothetical protein
MGAYQAGVRSGGVTPVSMKMFLSGTYVGSPAQQKEPAKTRTLIIKMPKTLFILFLFCTHFVNGDIYRFRYKQPLCHSQANGYKGILDVLSVSCSETGIEGRDSTDGKDCVSAIQTETIAAELRSRLIKVSEEQEFLTAIYSPGLKRSLIAAKGCVKGGVEAKTSGLR